jgi:hypothetical protein
LEPGIDPPPLGPFLLVDLNITAASNEAGAYIVRWGKVKEHMGTILRRWWGEVKESAPPMHCVGLVAVLLKANLYTL